MTKTPASACDAPEIAFGTKSLCPGASKTTNCRCPSNTHRFMLTSIVTPRSRSSGLQSITQAQANDDFPLALESRTFLCIALSSTAFKAYSNRPLSVDFPASTCPNITTCTSPPSGEVYAARSALEASYPANAVASPPTRVLAANSFTSVSVVSIAALAPDLLPRARAAAAAASGEGVSNANFPALAPPPLGPRGAAGYLAFLSAAIRASISFIPTRVGAGFVFINSIALLVFAALAPVVARSPSSARSRASRPAPAASSSSSYASSSSSYASSSS